jgi:hypothetical protein
MHYFSVLVGFRFLSSEDGCCVCHRRGDNPLRMGGGWGISSEERWYV